MRGLSRRARRAFTLLAAANAAAALTGCGENNNPAGPNGQQPDPCNTDPSLPQCPGPRGTFAYLPEATLSISFTAGTERVAVQGDFNGDGRMDLAFNERRDSPPLNRVHVAFGQPDGSFTVAPADDNGQPPPAEGWSTYRLLVGDVNGDGDDDLIWNHLMTSNIAYVGLSAGTGAFGDGPRQVHTQTVWNPYTVAVGDMNGDGKEDLVWNARSTASTRTYVGFASGTDGTLTMINNGTDRLGNFSEYDPALLGRFNSDAFDDVALSAISSTRNDIDIGRFTPVGAAAGFLTWTVQRRGAGWGGYFLSIADIDGRNGTDLIWSSQDSNLETLTLRTAVNDGTGVFLNAAPGLPISFPSGLQSEPALPLPVFADFDADGREDALVNRLSEASNELIIAFGTSGGALELATDVQTSTRTPTGAAGWLSFAGERFVGDVNGDRRADIVWSARPGSGPVRLFVALARRE